MSADSGPVGWAFLIARTRTRGYRLMLAPADRAAISRDLIERYARPDVNRGGPTIQLVRVGPAVLSLVFDTHRLTEADLGTVPVGTEPAGLVLDEHGRPIDAVYGFVCAAAVQKAAESDLAIARTQALDAYGRALTGGETPPSEPYRLESSLRAQPPARIDVRPMPLPPASPRSALAAPRRRTGSTRIGVIVAGAVTVLVGTIGGCIALRPSIAPVPEGLAGTWRGELEPTKIGSPTARTITVTIACEGACADRGRPIGTADDSYNCHYELLTKSIAEQTLTTSVTGTGPSADCLPPGTVGISRADQPDVITIDWNSTGSGQPGHMTATCTRLAGVEQPDRATSLPGPVPGDPVAAIARFGALVGKQQDGRDPGRPGHARHDLRGRETRRARPARVQSTGLGSAGGHRGRVVLEGLATPPRETPLPKDQQVKFRRRTYPARP